MSSTKPNQSLGERLHVALERVAFFLIPWRKRRPDERVQLEQATTEFVEPYLVRIAELETQRGQHLTCPICERALTLQEIKGGCCNAGHAGSSDIEHSIRAQLGWSGDASEERMRKRIAELEELVRSKSERLRTMAERLGVDERFICEDSGRIRQERDGLKSENASLRASVSVNPNDTLVLIASDDVSDIEAKRIVENVGKWHRGRVFLLSCGWRAMSADDARKTLAELASVRPDGRVHCDPCGALFMPDEEHYPNCKSRGAP